MSISRVRLAALVACCAFALIPQAQALTVGEFRESYAMAHILDNMNTEQREAYIAAHRPELKFAHAQLEAADLIAGTLVRMNLLQMQAGRPPFVCNYDEEAQGDIEVGDWIEEFRKEAPTRFKLEPGPKTDKILDQVEVDDVVAHKMMEKYPCPMPKTPHAAKTAARNAKAAETHAEHADNH